MAVLDTGDLEIPIQILDPWLGKIQNGSTIATLSGAQPMKFGPGQSMTFDIGEAEYVGEGANKGPSTIVPTVKTVTPYKFHKTLRWTEEVLWADEDHQLGVVSELLDLIQPSLSRALDFGVFHGIIMSGSLLPFRWPMTSTNLSQTQTVPGPSGFVVDMICVRSAGNFALP